MTIRTTRSKLSAALVLALLALAAVACGGGSGSKAEPPRFDVTGTVTGPVVDGVLMTLGGTAAATTSTLADGTYAFHDLVEGTYSITPSAENTTFDPLNRIFQVDGGDVAGIDFVSSGTGPSLEDVTPPPAPVRLVFVHHSCGGNWLDTGNGNLGNTLGSNNYYVRDVTYNWDAPQNTDIGSLTDIGHWYTWFADTTIQGNAVARRDNITGALYAANDQSALYTPIADPGGTNTVVVIKSCFNNSAVKNDNGSLPSALYGQPASSNAHTLSNCKEVYRQILAYFQTQPSHLFVVVTAPPLRSADTLLTDAANARALNDWLVDGWLKEANWEKKNVAVFDLFNVITDPDNHHRVVSGVIEHDNTHGDDFSAYATVDSHPNPAGNQKATDEFVPLLNAAWHRWQIWLGP